MDEFDLWGVGVLWISHWDEAVEDGDTWRVGGEGVIYSMPTGTLSATSSYAGSCDHIMTASN